MISGSWKLRSSCVALAIALQSCVAMAQSGPQLPYRVTADANGVNFPTGQVVLPGPSISIGAANGNHLDFNTTAYSGQVLNNVTHNYFMSLTLTNSSFDPIPANSMAYVALGGGQENFKSAGGYNDFASANNNGSHLSVNRDNATYTARDGTQIGFFRPSWTSNNSTLSCNSQVGGSTQSCYLFTGFNRGGTYVDYLPATITKPNGEVLTFSYEYRYIPVTVNGVTNSTGSIQYHLLSVRSSFGMEIRFNYATDFSSVTIVRAINNATEICANDATFSGTPVLTGATPQCSGLVNSWPNLQFTNTYTASTAGQPYAFRTLDGHGGTTSIIFDSSNTNNVSSITYPSGAVTNYTYAQSNYSVPGSSGYKVAGAQLTATNTSASDPGIKFTYDISWIADTSSSENQSYWNVTKGNPMVTKISNANGVVRTVVADSFTGNIAADADADGNKTTYAQKNFFGQIATITKPDTSYEEFGYDDRGNLTSQISHPISGSTLTPITKSAGYDSTCSNYVKCNQPNWTKDGLGGETDYTYDAASGLLTSVTGPTVNNIRPQTRYTYASMHGDYIISSSGSRGPSTVNANMLAGTSTCKTMAGTSLSGEPGVGPFSLSGAASCAGTADEVKTSVDYGPQVSGTATNVWPLSQTVSAGDNSVSSTSSQTYDRVGNIVTTVGPLGAAQTTIYYYQSSSLGPERRMLFGKVGPDPDGDGSRTPEAIKYYYNSSGKVIETDVGTVADQNADTYNNHFSKSLSTTVTYDDRGRPIQQDVASGTTTYISSGQLYDSLGRPYCQIQYMSGGALPSTCVPSTVTEPYGPDRVTQYEYDKNDRVVKQTTGVGTPAASTEMQTYTPNGDIKYRLDANSNVTNYTYDDFGRLKVTSYPSIAVGAGTGGSSSSSETLSYDANGNVLSTVLRDGNKISATYDALNRPITRSENDTLTRSFGYDLQGHLTSSVTAGGASTETMSYDALGQLTKRVEPYATMSYGYDSAGNRTQVTWGDNFTVNYSYDQTNNVTAIRENNATSGVALLAQYSYDNLGRRQSVAYGNGTSRTYAYDPIGRLAGLQLGFPNNGYNQTIGAVNGTGSPITWAPSSQMLSISRSNNAYLWTGASNLNRSYDVNGLNQYTSSGGVILGYDGRGNLSNSGSSTFTYDLLNRMSSWANPFYPGGMDMEYGALDELQGYGSTRFSYDGMNINGEYSFVSGGTSPMLHRYVYAPGDDEPIVWYVGSDTSQRRFLQADERGSIVAVTDASGGMIATNTYDEFGIPSSSNIGRFQYTGQTWFGELGLYNYKARWYSPSLGRFMQTDPIGYGDGMNWYNYAHGDPVNGSDPTGLQDGTRSDPYSVPPANIETPSWNSGGGSSSNSGSIWGAVSSFGYILAGVLGTGSQQKGLWNNVYAATSQNSRSQSVPDRCAAKSTVGGRANRQFSVRDGAVAGVKMDFFDALAIKYALHSGAVAGTVLGKSYWNSGIDMAEVSGMVLQGAVIGGVKSGPNLRVTFDTGGNVGYDKGSGFNSTSYTTVVFGPEGPRDPRSGLPTRSFVSVYPGC